MGKFEFQIRSLPLLISPTLQEPRVGLSEPEEKFSTKKTGSMENDPTVSPTVDFLASDYPALKEIFSPAKQPL